MYHSQIKDNKECCIHYICGGYVNNINHPYSDDVGNTCLLPIDKYKEHLLYLKNNEDGELYLPQFDRL